MTILLVQDDVKAAVPLLIGLQDQGFRTLHAGDGPQGLAFARAAQPDLVLLDADPSAGSGLGLPRLDGFAVCRTLRQESTVPIILFGTRGSERDRVRGLELGADDYLVQPYSFRELLARMRALLRRRDLERGRLSSPEDRMVMGDVVVDRAARQVWRAGRLVELRCREFEVLCVLMENAGQAIARHALLDQVWGADWIGDPRTVDVHVCWLRGKLEDDPSAPRYIQTVRGYGYRFADPAVSLARAA
jgi:DNA-binding response OmpR family regulator